MAIPTSAFFSAGASLIPSPVTATTSPRAFSSFTTRIFTVGVLRAITLILGSIFCSRRSLTSSTSLASSATQPSASRSSSLAMAVAVTILSPVRIFTPTPALRQAATASYTSLRSGSAMATKPSKTISLSIRRWASFAEKSSISANSLWAKAITRMACSSACTSTRHSSARRSGFKAHISSTHSGLPFT